MSTTYVNPDAPNPDITNAAVRSMMSSGQPTGYSTPSMGYYPGGNANPFMGASNVTSVPTNESRANVGYPMPQQPFGGYTQPTGMAPAWNPNTGIAPAWNPTTGSFNQLSMFTQQGLMSQGYQQPVSGYNGYPIGIGPENYIFEYMKNNTAPKNYWGDNYWTTPKPMDQPQIDWTQKAQPVYNPYAQCGMYGCQPQQPAPVMPPNLTFAPVPETPLDYVKKNWKNNL